MKKIALVCLLSCTALTDLTALADTNQYQIIEIKEGEFQPKTQSGKIDNKKYSAYFMSLEGEDAEDQYKRNNYYYVGLKAGGVIPMDLGGNSALSGQAPNSAYTIGASFGRKFMNRYAVEVEYMFRQNSNVNNNTGSTASNTWGAKSNSYMVNVSADILTTLLRPYVKAGVGMSQNQAKNFVNTSGATTNTYSGKNTNQFTWQIGAGLSAPISQNFDFNLEYMYINRGKIETSATKNVSTPVSSVPSTANTGYLKDNLVTAGIKAKF